MKILLIHNAYRERGGEDTVFEQESELLRCAGHEVIAYQRSNAEIEGYSPLRKLVLPIQLVWSSSAYAEVRQILRSTRPEIVHVHNTFMVTSPSVYTACKKEGVPVVQTLHNYRLYCPAATFLRNGEICEECVQHSLWRSVSHACYHGSHAQSAAVAAMLAAHRLRGTWANDVDVYIALTEFSRKKFIAAGLPAEKIVVKPNFVHPDPGVRSARTSGDYALFIGRLSAEKGVATLLAAWERMPREIPLTIVGDGPLRHSLASWAQQKGLSNISFLGRLTRSGALDVLKRARFLVFPSEWYEGFAMTLVEAFACGVSVVVSRMGVMPEIVEEQRTGIFFRPGDAEDLAAKSLWAWTHSAEMERMGATARQEYEAKYSGIENYRMLMRIYKNAIRPSAASEVLSGRAAAIADH